MNEVKFTSRARFNEEPIGEAGMREVGEQFLSSLDNRLGQGFNCRDEPSLPLHPKYQKWKLSKGLQGIRDWWINGFLRRSFQLLNVSENRVQIGPDDPDARVILAKNQAIERQFGVSPNDLSAIVETVHRARTVGKAEKV